MLTALDKCNKCKIIKNRGWILRKDARHLILENPKYGSVQVVANCNKNKFFDQIIYIEPPGAAAVVLVDKQKGKIYLHTEWRPAVVKNKNYLFKKGKLKINFKHLGRKSVEVPRGFSEGTSLSTIIKEVREETGFNIRKDKFKRIGEINSNTAFVVSNISVYVVKLRGIENLPSIGREEAEKIKKRGWYSINIVKKMIKKGEIFCAITLAALNLVFQRLRDK